MSNQPGNQRTVALTREHLKPTDEVLEMGCGTGSVAFLVAPSVSSYLATDLSSEMIRLAEERRKSHPELPGLVFRVATAEEVAENLANKFNAVLGYNYLHLVHDPWATVATIRDMLVDGGVFVNKSACMLDVTQEMRSVTLPAMQLAGTAPHVSCFSREELRHKIEQAGFEMLADEIHGSGDDARPCMVARKK
jgi:ubiquinone/menaquinone biosynthesis C-methylase UbiE